MTIALPWRRHEAVQIPQVRDAGPRSRPSRPVRGGRCDRPSPGPGHVDHPALSRGIGAGHFRDGVLLGSRARILEAPGGLDDRSGVCRRIDAKPFLQGGLQRTDRPHRSGAGAVRPGCHQLRDIAAYVLRGPRSDPRHAPGQRPGNAVPLGDLHHHREQAATAEEVAARFQGALAAARRGAITTEIGTAGAFFYAEPYHQQYLAANPGGYCGIGGTGVRLSDA